MIFTTGNIITFALCLVSLIVFRQLDKNNRSIEKVKKYGDKLKNDLDQFVNEKLTKLDDSTVALSVEQTKALAAVKRLDSIHEEFVLKEKSLQEQLSNVESLAKQITSYDVTITQLLDMTARAQENLSKITAESDFADSLGKKVLASQKNLEDILQTLPELKKSFALENQRALEKIGKDTISKIEGVLSHLDSRTSHVQKEVEKMLGQAEHSLTELFKKSMAEASLKADSLEDSTLVKLKEQATERLSKYKTSIEEKTSALHELTKERVQETQGLIKTFKADWHKEAEDYLEAVRSEILDLKNTATTTTSTIETTIAEIKANSEKRLESVQIAFEANLQDLNEKLGLTTNEIESKLELHKQDVQYRLTQFSSHLSDADKLEAQLRLSMEKTESKINDEFSSYTIEIEGRHNSFEQKMIDQSETLSNNLKALEVEINELKTRAYDNVSSKLQLFEDDFFKDLAQRGEAITTELENWQATVSSSLSKLANESEASRSELELKYEQELKDRLALIYEQYRVQTQKIEENISAIDLSLRTKITASDQSILNFVEQSRLEFAQARESALSFNKKEFDSYTLTIQEQLRKQEKEVEQRTKVFIDSIENAKSESEIKLESLRTDFNAWQLKNNQNFSAAKEWLQEQITALTQDSKQNMILISDSWQSQFKDFNQKTAEERTQLEQRLESLKRNIVQAESDFKLTSKETFENIETVWKNFSVENDQKIKVQAKETEMLVQNLKVFANEIKDTIEQTRDKTFQKIQQETAGLQASLEDIDQKQKAFVSQTRLFERADQLKQALDADIERLSNNVNHLDTFKETMVALEQQYSKIRKLDDETTQKLSKFASEKKRIDIMESDFEKLLTISDSIDKKLNELTGTSDELQQIQVHLRRYEETITEVNTRYDRLDKKALVLDRTIDGIDQAFEQLKKVEDSVNEYQKELEKLSFELSSIQKTLIPLSQTEGKANLVIERISTLDDVLTDIEKRTEKMQSSREWLARTETRLEEISKQSEDHLKLLGTLLKEEVPSKKSKGAPPIGIRENVIKLSHQGWKVDEIARALHISRGEVELILEMPTP